MSVALPCVSVAVYVAVYSARAGSLSVSVSDFMS